MVKPPFEIYSFRGGISDWDDKGIPGAFKYARNLDIRKRVDSLSCQQLLVKESGLVVTSLIRFFVKCNDGNTYGFSDSGLIYKRTSAGAWSQTYTDPDGAIKGAAEWYDNTGKTYLYWATDTKLKRKEIPGNANWTDVSTVATNLKSTGWHTMRECGGSLIICNKTYLGLVGYDGSYTNQALDLIPGNVAKTLVERNGRTIVGTIRASDSIGINGAIDSEVPIAQVGNDGEIFYADGHNSVAVKDLPGGGYVNPGGIANEVDQVNFFEWDQDALSWIDKQAVGNMALLGVYGADTGYGGIYTFGRKNKNHPLVLNLEYYYDADEIGAVANIGGTTIFSYKTGSEYGAMKVNSSQKISGIYEGLDLKAKAKIPAAVTIWKYAEVFCQPMPSGTSFEFWYKINKTGNFIQAKTADGDTDFDTYDADKAVFNIGAEGEIFEPRLVLTPNGNISPEIYRIRIFYE